MAGKRPPRINPKGIAGMRALGGSSGSRGTFSNGSRSASSSNDSKNTNQRSGGGSQRRDSKGRFR